MIKGAIILFTGCVVGYTIGFVQGVTIGMDISGMWDSMFSEKNEKVTA